jgi:uroporphyrinogen decarboxylase
MNSKERVLTVLSLKEPDRVPIFVTLAPGMAAKLAEYLGRDATNATPVSSLLSNRLSYTELLIKLGNDIVAIGPCYPPNTIEKYPNGTFTDEWGIRYRKVKPSGGLGFHTEMVEHPLSGVEDERTLSKYKLPDSHDPHRYELAQEMVRKYGSQYAIIGVVECTILELSWYLVGMEKFFEDLLMEKPYILKLMDEIMTYNIEVGKELIKLGADIIWTGDDYGAQRGMLISPELWRKHFKPRMKKVYDEFKKTNPEVKIAHHSCGSIRPIIGEMIEIGVEVLNPIQPRAANMEPKSLKEEFGDSLVFLGGIDQQHTMPRGGVEDVKKEVKTRIAELGGGGGYLLAPAHDIQADVPVENVLALFEETKRIGRYN